ncbi:MAG TPA: acetylxylan esterase [bacterium]|nr:acetylxylan esterase [bacterium]
MNKTLWQYYVDKATEITDNALEDIKNLEQWKQERQQIKKEFFISMGLNSILEKSTSVIKTLGEFKGDGFIAKKIAYQILPDCWSSGHFYLPDPLPEKKLPAVLYACGHAKIGTHWYQKHAIMWARRGYACFVFETIIQSENTGWHHGLHTGKRLDWISLGYTAAGGELLNSIHALDVLCQMPEVDINRIGVTGISGGGAHSHFLAIADERIKTVATSAGISSIKSALGNRTMFQHCDCMYAHGNFQRDISEFSALIAPKPILYCFASHDNLFAVDEYKTLYSKVKRIYELYGCPEKCELFEYPGPHAYSDASIKKINEWFDRYVAEEQHPDVGLNNNDIIPEHIMSVFNGKSPEPNRLNLLPELLTVQRTRPLPKNEDEWEIIRTDTLKQLKTNVFHWLDRCNEKMEIRNIGKWDFEGRSFSRYRAENKGMEVYIEAYAPKITAETTIIALGDYGHNTTTLMKKIGESTKNCNQVLVESRACGRNAANIEQGNYCLYRAGALVGITPVMMWMNDLKYIVEFFRNIPEYKTDIVLYGAGEAAGACLYYAIFDERISGVIIDDAPDTHAKGCYIPGVLKEIDITEASGLIAPRIFGVVFPEILNLWVSKMHWGIRVYERLGMKNRYIMSHSTNIAITKVLSDI